MMIAIVEGVFFIFFIVFGIMAVQRARAAQKKKIEGYRKSTDSKVIKLNE